MRTCAHRLGFVVPTKDRPRELRRMLTSLQVQSVRPDQIIIVDASKDPVSDLVREFSDLAIDYVHIYPPSLSRQRNAGMRRLLPTITLAGYLDDDLVIEDGAVEAMLAFWETAPADLGGAAFNIINTCLPRGAFLKSLFLLESRQQGILLPSGFQASLWPVRATTYVRWLCGGATIWRREIVEQFDYDEWFEGTGYLEDLDYSYRVGKKYQLAIVEKARVQHLSPPLRKEVNYLLGKWQAINRVYFVKKHPEFSLPLCYWALIGEATLNAGKAFMSLDRHLFMRVLGNISGICLVIAGRLERIGGILK